MPWYKAGTVSVAQNSNTVTGTGTSFITNSRVGDAFLGPDGRWYEVTNIASDTAIAISPNYLGATTGVGGYALAPMQGYVKDSADALRALVNQFGEKLAALKTTGNYDILPVSKGGTGAQNEAGSRLALGLATQQVDAVPVSRGGTGANDPLGARQALGLGPSASLGVGAVEITAPLPFIDFHFNNTTTDYNVRLINSADGTLSAQVANSGEFRINGFSAWNDGNGAAKILSIGVGGIGSYAFCLTNTALTPGNSTVGGNLQYAFATGQGTVSPTGTWRCMGDTVAGGRTLFQRVS
jgi:hypothetical protein